MPTLRAMLRKSLSKPTKSATPSTENLSEPIQKSAPADFDENVTVGSLISKRPTSTPKSGPLARLAKEDERNASMKSFLDKTADVINDDGVEMMTVSASNVNISSPPITNDTKKLKSMSEEGIGSDIPIIVRTSATFFERDEESEGESEQDSEGESDEEVDNVRDLDDGAMTPASTLYDPQVGSTTELVDDKPQEDRPVTPLIFRQLPPQQSSISLTSSFPFLGLLWGYVEEYMSQAPSPAVGMRKSQGQTDEEKEEEKIRVDDAEVNIWTVIMENAMVGLHENSNLILNSLNSTSTPSTSSTPTPPSPTTPLLLILLLSITLLHLLLHTTNTLSTFLRNTYKDRRTEIMNMIDDFKRFQSDVEENEREKWHDRQQ